VEDVGVRSLLWSPYRNYLVVGARDGSVRVWNVENWQETILITGLNEICSIVLTHDGQHIVVSD